MKLSGPLGVIMYALLGLRAFADNSYIAPTQPDPGAVGVLGCYLDGSVAFIDISTPADDTLEGSCLGVLAHLSDPTNVGGVAPALAIPLEPGISYEFLVAKASATALLSCKFAADGRMRVVSVEGFDESPPPVGEACVEELKKLGKDKGNSKYLYELFPYGPTGSTTTQIAVYQIFDFFNTGVSNRSASKTPAAQLQCYWSESVGKLLVEDFRYLPGYDGPQVNPDESCITVINEITVGTYLQLFNSVTAKRNEGLVYVINTPVQLFSEEWANGFKARWNADSELSDALAKINFNSVIGYGFDGEDKPRCYIHVENGRVTEAAPYTNQKLNWDLRATPEAWQKWLSKPPDILGLDQAYTSRKLKFNVGDYAAMFKNPRLAGPFIRSFAVMGG